MKISRIVEHVKPYTATILVFSSVAVVGVVSMVGSNASPYSGASSTNKAVDKPKPAQAPSPPANKPATTPANKPTPPAAVPKAATPVALSSQAINLTNWKLTLPIAGSKGTAAEISQPALASYVIDPWFVPTPDKAGIVFRANHGGATTSGSSNPRSELREMTNNGASPAAWQSGAGVHTMTISQRVTRLTSVKPHVVVGQIHDANDDVSVFRLEGNKLWITDGDNTHAHLLTDSYKLGDNFTVKFEVRDNVIHYYFNGQKVNYTQNKVFGGAYFKAGNYLQSNPKSAPSEAAGAFSEVIITGLSVTH